MGRLVQMSYIWHCILNIDHFEFQGMKVDSQHQTQEFCLATCREFPRLDRAGRRSAHNPFCYLNTWRWHSRNQSMLGTQLCLTLCDPMDCSPPGSSVHGILQARVQEWIPFPSPGGLPHPGISPRSAVLQVDSSPSETPGKPLGNQSSQEFCKWDVSKMKMIKFSS